MSHIFLDHAAATPLDPVVFEAMKPWFCEQYANPSSLCQSGQKARAALDKARMTIAGFLEAAPTEIMFTASGTESCNWAMLGVIEPLLRRGESCHLIVSAIEHSAVLETARFLESERGVSVSYLPVNQEGLVEVERLQQELRATTKLVSIMTVNNEIGTIQPIAQMGKICRELGIVMHTDACQAAGWMKLNVQEMSVDLLSLNAAKIYGPKGAAALYVREGIEMDPWTFGGGQEFKRRAGTENVPAIVGFGKAVELLLNRDDHSSSIRELRDQLWMTIQDQIDGVHVNGSWEQRTPNNLNLWIEGVDGESLVHRLDLDGICVSMGSACASGEVEPSHVLMALGRSEEAARSSIRITLGKGNTREDMEKFIELLKQSVSILRK